jgi:Uma2 family endonuclease
MVAVGLFEDERIELIDGLLVAMSPQTARHAAVIERLTHKLISALQERARVRVQLPLALGEHAEPEPDLAVVPWAEHDEGHPTSALLVVEVADSSLAIDRGRKATLYAQSGVPEYWVVNLAADLIEAHTEPAGDRYAVVTPHRRGSALRPKSFPDVEIAASDILR